MQAFEVGHLWLIAGFGQHFETDLDKFLNATTQHSLLAEQVGHSLRFESGRNHTGAGATDSGSVRQAQGLALTLGVLLHGDEAGNTLAIHELTTHQVAWPLGGNHAHGDIGGWLDQVEVNVEAVAEQQSIAVRQVRLDLFLVHLGLGGVRDQHHDDIGPGGGVRIGQHLETGLFGFFGGLGALTQANHNLHARIPQVLGVSMPLGAIAQHRNLTSLDERQIGIGVVKHFNSHK